MGLSAQRGGRTSSSAQRLDRTLSALADPHRRQVVELLREGPRRAGELAKAVGLAPSALSRHLKALKTSGLIDERHPAFDARVRVYMLRPEPMTELKQWLERTEQMWSEQLLSLRDYLGQDHRREPE